MEPHTKLWVEELLKQIHEEIKDGFTAHIEFVNKRFAEREIVDIRGMTVSLRWRQL
jgi:hypothetical protein